MNVYHPKRKPNRQGRLDFGLPCWACGSSKLGWRRNGKGFGPIDPIKAGDPLSGLCSTCLSAMERNGRVGHGGVELVRVDFDDNGEE